MKIVDIKTTLLTAPLKTPFITSLRRVDTLEDLVVIMTCDDGTVGYGEGAPTPVITGETIDTMKAAIDYLKPFIIGKEISELDTILKNIHTKLLHNTTAKSALEIALYDLRAKAGNLPLYRLLGGSKRTFKTDITISMDETQKMISDALHAVSIGYDTLKIKIGDDPIKDSERIIAIYEALPKNIRLRLDANQGWEADEAITLLQKIESYGIIAEFIEQPLRADDIDGLKQIKDAVKTPLLADESVFSLNDAKRLLEHDAVDYINIKLDKCGGISKALELADLCKKYGVKCMLGCMLEGPIAIAGALHVASAKADTITMIDLDGAALLAHNPVSGTILFDESNLLLSDEIGLGIDAIS
ncbi:mandelate racemase/muconate lactonizing enzyme family protein [Sulfurovum mangrovi]|uniref:mandelate racemase/muconate lactonizing enzyme family protein n=1 Tax=Sulfurovum mangrovi TaxID=2893889 RepID=UPI001E53156A|nr:dipeptide epimerase [Sulfurovum mangrovi]UFH58102.1 dipeptide epimerase [Sulfurovum mangrovi]